ncbi:hypothetical protein [Streptomyces sp. NBC_00091]|uniref:hypothetical protein n=1 Tax=Streptomyces sp. NBC_00091 TaxID=2975648 RepID=UPI00224CDF8B|nr:hypothetical protein [Streptomyces sp. NBC_00091]MCX5378688.1 hypothetical protein [Streptomyces sp. NBC_00091]
MTARPSRAGIARVWAGSLMAVLVRRPPVPGPRHSAGLRQLVLPLVAMEIVVAFLLSSMLPPVARPAHAAFEALLVLAGLGLVAAVLRHPHEVDAERVVLRTGFLGDVTLPRSAVRSASPVVRTVPGRGPRPVPGEPGAVACSVDASLNVAVHLDPPVRLDLGAAGLVDAATVYTSADSLPALSAALRATPPTPR